MKNEGVAELAAALGVSKATVSRALAGLYLGDDMLKALPLLVLTTSGHSNRNVGARCGAFLDEIHSHGRKEYGVISLEYEYLKSAKTFPSRAASLLKSAAGAINGSFVLYSALGYARLPLAIEKARLSDKTVLICHGCAAHRGRSARSRSVRLRVRT